MSAGDRWDADDDRVGVPTAGGGGLRGLTPPARHDGLPPELREGETELGRPPQVPGGLAELTDADRDALRRQDDEQAAGELAEAERLLAGDPAGFGWVGWFGSPLALAFLVGAAGLAGLFVFNQVLSVLAALAAQPDYLRYIGYAGLVLLGGCVLYSFVRFAFLYATLRRNQQVQVRGLRELARRTRLRWLATAKTAEAKEQLEGYLRAYPMDAEKDRKLLRAAGLDDDAQGRLRAARDGLLDPAKFASSDEWFGRFRDRFQAELDAAAEARVRFWGARVWVVTAVAPNAVIDTGATLYYTLSMLTDLCRVYNLRAGRTGTAALLGRVFVNAYLAGQGADLEKLVEDQYDGLFGEVLGVAGAGAGGNLAGKLLGKVGARATTGYLNRVLVVRLGRFAARLLRPVAAG